MRAVAPRSADLRVAMLLTAPRLAPSDAESVLASLTRDPRADVVLCVGIESGALWASKIGFSGLQKESKFEAEVGSQKSGSKVKQGESGEGLIGPKNDR